MHSNTLLPIHPTKRHPLTGEPIQAVWVSPSGRVCWPIMGGAPDDGDGSGSGSDGSGDGSDKDAGGADDKDADKGGGQDKGQGADDGGDKGFPENTKVEDMTVAQQAAYYRHQSRKHEDRNRQLLTITGGKYGDDLKADLDELGKLRTDRMTDSEKAVAEARKEGGREAGLAAARTILEIALGHSESNDKSALIDTLDLSKVLTDTGSVDTAKVKTLAGQLAPADKETGNRDHDYGAGRRGGRTKSGLGAGAEMFAASRKKSTSTTT